MAPKRAVLVPRMRVRPAAAKAKAKAKARVRLAPPPLRPVTDPPQFAAMPPRPVAGWPGAQLVQVGGGVEEVVVEWSTDNPPRIIALWSWFQGNSYLCSRVVKYNNNKQYP